MKGEFLVLSGTLSAPPRRRRRRLIRHLFSRLISLTLKGLSI